MRFWFRRSPCAAISSFSSRRPGEASKVEIGIRGITDVEILSGLGEDARVISPFPENLADGARVKSAKE